MNALAWTAQQLTAITNRPQISAGDLSMPAGVREVVVTLRDGKVRSVQMLCAEMNVSVDTTRDRVRRAAALGLIECCRKDRKTGVRWWRIA